MPPEEIKKALEEAEKKLSEKYEGLDALLEELNKSADEFNENNKKLSDALSRNAGLEELSVAGNAARSSKEQATQKNRQIIGLCADDLNSQMKPFFGGPKSANEKDVLSWVTDNYLLFKLLSNSRFLEFNPISYIISVNTRIPSAVKLAGVLVSKTAPQLPAEDGPKAPEDEQKYSADLQAALKSLQSERTAFTETTFDTILTEIGRIAAASGKAIQTAPQAQAEQNKKPAEAPGSNIPQELPVPIKPTHSYDEARIELERAVRYTDNDFLKLNILFNRNNFANGNKELGLVKQTLGSTLLRMIDEFSERKDDAEKYYDSIEGLSAEKAYTEIRNYYQKIYDLSESYIKKNKDAQNDSVKKCVNAAQMANSYAREIIYNCRAKLGILKYTEKERSSAKKISMFDVLTNKVPAEAGAAAKAENNEKAASGAKQEAGIKDDVAAKKNASNADGLHQEAEWLAKTAAKMAEQGDRFSIFHSRYAEYSAHINLLEGSKTFSNSGEYLKIISTLKDLTERQLGPDDGLTPKERYFSELVGLKLKIDKYIVHKSKDGVKKNVYSKLAAVEGLNRFITDELDKLSPEIIADKSKPEMQNAKEKFQIISNSSLHPDLKQTYTPEQTKERALSAEEYDSSFSKDSYEKTLTCMDRIIHFAKPNMAKELKKMQEEFYYNPGKGEYRGKADAKKALEDAEKALHMDSSRKSILKNVLDQGGEFKFDSEDFHSELKYCYALRKNLNLNLNVLKEDEIIYGAFNMAQADSMIGDLAAKVKSEKPLFGYNRQFDSDRADIVFDIGAINNAVKEDLLNKAAQNKKQFSEEMDDKTLFKSWPELSLTGKCYKALLQESSFRKNNSADVKKVREVADLFTKLENRVKHIAGVAVEEPEKKASLQQGGMVK